MDVRAQMIRVIRGVSAWQLTAGRGAKEKAAMGATAASIAMSVNWTDCSMSTHYA